MKNTINLADNEDVKMFLTSCSLIYHLLGEPKFREKLYARNKTSKQLNELVVAVLEFAPKASDYELKVTNE